MALTLPQLIDGFRDVRVLVVGDAMLDVYLDGSTERLCREAPVPVVEVATRTCVPGGAANTAVNVCELGGQARLLTVVGDDAEGLLLQDALAQRGVATDDVVVAVGRRTRTAERVSADDQLLVRFDHGTHAPLDETTEAQVRARLREAFVAADAVIVSDYDHGVLGEALRRELATLQEAHPRVLVVDAKQPAAYRALRPTAVKPNYAEAARLLGLPGDGQHDRAELLLEHGDLVLELTGARIAAVTVDTEGAIVLERGRPPYRTYARPVRHSHATGAGDTFVSALTLALAAGAHTPAAAELASAAAAVVVEKDRTATCEAEELHAQVLADEKYATDVRHVAVRLQLYRHQARRIVFTNGCFDILHRGHITYLNKAKSLGDVLIVGLNSDDSVRRLKGPGRPINTLEDRAQVLAALSCVDHIVAFSGDTAAELIKALRPDVFVKGGDYTRETLPEADLVERLGGTVELLPYVSDKSTTGIIDRILDASR